MDGGRTSPPRAPKDSSGAGMWSGRPLLWAVGADAPPSAGLSAGDTQDCLALREPWEVKVQ